MSVAERVMGTEVEYAIDRTGFEGAADIGQISIAECLPFGLRRVGDFLSNGGRLYKDVGDHVEYATPECLGPLEATQYEIAGEAIMLGLVELIGERSKRRHTINKRLCDPKGNQWGSHHSFELSRDLFNDITRAKASTFGQDLLVSHLATSTVYTGSGTYRPDGDYYLSQKRWHTSSPVTVSTTGKDKGLINTRDEAHSGGNERSARLHVQAGEASISPWATWMQLATFSILLRVIESGWEPNVPILDNAADAAQRVARDLTLARGLDLTDSSRLNAVAIQTEYAKVAMEAKEKGLLSPEESLAADEWKSIVADLPVRNTVECGTRVDWIARKEVVDAGVAHALRKAVADPERDPTDIDKELLQQELDLIYDRLGKDGTGYSLRRRGHFALRFTDAEIENSINYPPVTRAKTRAEFILHHDESRSHVGLNWGTVEVDGLSYQLGPAGKYNPALAGKLIGLATRRKKR